MPLSVSECPTKKYPPRSGPLEQKRAAALLRHLVEARGFIHAGAGFVENARRNIARQDLHIARPPARRLAGRLKQRHGDGVGLFAGGTGRAPDPQRRPFAKLPRRPLPQKVEVRRLAEERGVIRRQRIDQRRQRLAGLVRRDPAEILLEPAEPPFANPPGQPRGHQTLLALGQIQAELFAGERADFAEIRRAQDRRFQRAHAAAFPNRASGSRIRPTRPSPRIAPPATPRTWRSDSPRLLITTSCLPISSSTARQKRLPSASVTISRLSHNFSDFGRTPNFRCSRTTGSSDPRTSTISSRLATVEIASSRGLNISRTAETGIT